MSEKTKEYAIDVDLFLKKLNESKEYEFTIKQVHAAEILGVHQQQLTRIKDKKVPKACLLYTSPSPRDRQKSRMPSSA